jgi:transcriptional regulator with XRE-family HTH domain
MTPEQLKALRKKLKLTQTDLAFQIGLTQGSISQMESGTKPIEQVTALAIEHLSCKKRRKR